MTKSRQTNRDSHATSDDSDEDNSDGKSPPSGHHAQEDLVEAKEVDKQLDVLMTDNAKKSGQ